jgi:hypothetical protein
MQQATTLLVSAAFLLSVLALAALVWIVSKIDNIMWQREQRELWRKQQQQQQQQLHRSGQNVRREAEG